MRSVSPPGPWSMLCGLAQSRFFCASGVALQSLKELLRRAGKSLEAAPLFHIARFSFPSSDAAYGAEKKNSFDRGASSAWKPNRADAPRAPVKRFIGCSVSVALFRTSS